MPYRMDAHARLPTDVERDLAALAFHDLDEALAVVGLEDGLILEANARFEDVSGVLGGIVGRSSFALGLWADVGGVETVRARLSEAGAIESFSAHLRTGRERGPAIRLSARVLEGAAVPSVLVRASESAEDTLTRHLELRDGEVHYRALLEQISAITYTEIEDESSPTGYRDVYISPQTTAILGYSPEEWRRDPTLWIRAAHPDDRDRIIGKEDRDRAAIGQVFRSEYRVVARDGRVVWFRDEAVKMEHPTTGARFWQGVMFDITEEKRIQEHVRETDLRWRTLVETLPAAVFIEGLDDQATTYYISPQVENMVGYPAQEWIDDPGLWQRDVIHPDDRRRVIDATRRHNETNEPFEEEYRIICRDGRIIWVRDVAVVVRDGDEEPSYAQGFLIDVTERKEAERALEHALLRERDATTRLRTADQLKNTLLNTLSHDVRNPLTSILGIASMLQRGDVELSDDERLELLSAIERSGRKIKQLLTDLLDLDRLEKGVLSLEREPTDVGELIDDLLLESEMLEERQVSVEASDLDPVDVDPIALGRIVDNLLVNAARHTPAGTQMWIRAETTEQGLLLAVDDEGPGVPDERKEVIFEPFRRGDELSVPGTGVGLSLVTRFAELHGGRAWVEDRPGGGASFRVLLP
jgi:PAS domain S-box-containing protein